MTRAYQLAYVDLETNLLDEEISYYQRIIGATAVEAVASDRAYFSLGLDHHNISLKAAPTPRLAAIGLRIEPQPIADTLAHLQRLGLSGVSKSDSRPGVSALVEVDLGGQTFHLVPDMAMTGVGFRHSGIVPTQLGHLAVMSSEAEKLVKFLSAIGFRATDWFEETATFLTCNRLHHVLNVVNAPFNKLHHLAYELRSRAAHHDVADFLATEGHGIVWGPSRHTAGHNLASYHFDPSHFLVECYTDMDIVIPELDIFEPRPWHDAFPQRPRVWPLGQLTTWNTRFDFDFRAV
ncbi:VOC family protein [Bradyrhizobium sp. USDA 4486]